MGIAIVLATTGTLAKANESAVTVTDPSASKVVQKKQTVNAALDARQEAEPVDYRQILRQKAKNAYTKLRLDRHQNIYLKPFQDIARSGPASKIREGDVLEVEATGYDASVASTGDGDGITASLTKFRYGVAAVDPKVIPIGTILYVEGYGYARAEDVGSAIKGRKVDLAFPKRSDAFDWGRQREVKVTVLAVPDLNEPEVQYPILKGAL